MLKTILSLGLVSMLVIVMGACSLQTVPTANPDIVGTAIAQTLAASTPTSQAGIPVTGNESPTPTMIMLAPSATPIGSPVPSVTATSNVTPAVPQVSVSVATNCRTGPSIAFERVGFLDAGKTAQVVGRNPEGTYWLIQNPNGSSGTCWLWGQFATVAGNSSTIPVVVPPPTPTPVLVPNFDAAFNGLQSCTGTGWWVDIELANTGGISFRSITLTVKDTTNNTTLTSYADGFTETSGCNAPQSRTALPSGITRIVSSPPFQYDLTGHKLNATVTVCSNSGQSGSCVTKSFDFTP